MKNNNILYKKLCFLLLLAANFSLVGMNSQADYGLLKIKPIEILEKKNEKKSIVLKKISNNYPNKKILLTTDSESEKIISDNFGSNGSNIDADINFNTLDSWILKLKNEGPTGTLLLLTHATTSSSCDPKTLATLEIDPPSKALLNPNKQNITIFDNDGIYTHNIKENKIEHVFNTSNIQNFIYSPLGTYLLIHERTIIPGETDAGLQDVIIILESATYKPVVGLKHADVINKFAINQQENLIAATSTKNSTITIWDLKTSASLKKIIDTAKHPNNVLAFSPNGKFLAVASSIKNIFLWDVATGSKVAQMLGYNINPITSLMFSPNGKHLVGATKNSTITWSLPSHLYQEYKQEKFSSFADIIINTQDE